MTGTASFQRLFHWTPMLYCGPNPLRHLLRGRGKYEINTDRVIQNIQHTVHNTKRNKYKINKYRSHEECEIHGKPFELTTYVQFVQCLFSPVTQAHIHICFLCGPIVVQCSEGVGGQLAGVCRVAANGGAESGRVGGGDRHKATWGWASCPGTGPGSGERTQPAAEEEQRAGGSGTDAGQGGLLTGTNSPLWQVAAVHFPKWRTGLIKFSNVHIPPAFLKNTLKYYLLINLICLVFF